MKHIIDTVSKLKKECDVMCGDSPHDVRIYNEAIDDALQAIRALIANSPQADGNAPPDVYDIAVDTGDGIYHTAEVVHFQQSGSKRMIQVRLGDQKADDVRKDAWISVENRLPEIGQQFLGLSEETIDHYKRESLHRVYNMNSNNYSRKDIFKHVTHWQPLPSPPLDKAREL